MKKIAVLGDIHSNLEALKAVIEDAKSLSVTDFICIGDIVGYNADPKACIEIVREFNMEVIKGNHDHYCSSDESLDDFHPLAANVIAWTRQQLSHNDIQFLRGLKLVKVIRGFTIVHSTLDMPEKWGYVFDTLEAEASINYQTTSLCFHGHTHVPVVYEKVTRVRCIPFDKIHLQIGCKYFINVGSVGQPRDGDPRAAYCIYSPSERTVELRRVEYDIELAQDKIRRAGLPERLAKRLKLGK